MKANWAFRLSAATALAMAIAAPGNSRSLTGGQTVDMDGLAARLRPFLSHSGKGVKIYYPAACSIVDGFEFLNFPPIALRQEGDGRDGIRGIRKMLPPGAIIEEGPKVISIKLGEVPQSIRGARIKSLKLSSMEQYDDALAVLAIKRYVDANYSAKIKYKLPTEDISVFPSAAMEGRHLPSELDDMTADGALDQVASTFRSIVFFGACEDRRLFSMTSRWGGR